MTNPESTAVYGFDTYCQRLEQWRAEQHTDANHMAYLAPRAIALIEAEIHRIWPCIEIPAAESCAAQGDVK